AEKLSVSSVAAAMTSPLVNPGTSFYFGMSTTCHLIFHQMLARGLTANDGVELYSSNIPLLLSAEIERVPCNVYGSALVHDYASLTFTPEQLKDATVRNLHFDFAFIGARSVY